MGIKHAGFFVDGMPHQAIALISTAVGFFDIYLTRSHHLP